MKKILISLLSLVLVLSVFTSTAYAANITGVEAENLPDLTVKIGAAPGKYDNLDSSKIKATLDGQELVVGGIDKEDASVEWIIMIDTSISLSEEHFQAQKNAVLSVLKSLRDTDTLKLYTFAEKVSQKLRGNESYETAARILKGIECNGQDTAFYAAATKLAQLATESDSAVCVPVIFSDGVETLDKGSKAATEKALKESPNPIYGFYPNVVDDATRKAFDSMIKKSGGSTKSFTKANAAKQLASFNSDDTYSVSFTATQKIEAKNNAKLVIDIDGDKIEKEIVVTDWAGDTEAPDVVSAISDETRKVVSVMFSEVIENWNDESIYQFSTVEGDVPKITDISRSSDETVVLTVDQLDSSGIKLLVSGYKDAAGNVGEEKDFSLTINENIVKTLKTAGIILGGVVVLILVLLTVIMKLRRKKKANEEALVQAAYKNGKKIEPKKKKEKPKKEKMTAAEKAAAEKAEKLKKKEEERRRAEEAKFKFYFEDKFDPNDRED